MSERKRIKGSVFKLSDDSYSSSSSLSPSLLDRRTYAKEPPAKKTPKSTGPDSCSAAASVTLTPDPTTKAPLADKSLVPIADNNSTNKDAKGKSKCNPNSGKSIVRLTDTEKAIAASKASIAQCEKDILEVSSYTCLTCS